MDQTQNQVIFVTYDDLFAAGVSDKVRYQFRLVVANRYDDFINNMQIRADNQLSFSIFAEPDSFAYKNIQQTPLDFQHLKGVELYAGNNTFAENATQFQITDYLMIVLVALTCILLFYTERENGLYPLVRSTKNGRTSTIVAKLFAVIAVTVVTTILFYL